jgi:hypothetical protein
MPHKTIEGLYGIKATVICDSITVGGVRKPVRMLTLEIEYPRIVHSELMTHRDKSRNAASSRAIPFAKMQEQLTARPVRFGEANKGMQDKGEDYDVPVDIGEILGFSHKYTVAADVAWDMAGNTASKYAKAFYGAGYHKQVYNRLTEPFQMMKTVISGTEWGNFFWLRDDDAVDPTLRELVRVMKLAMEASTPVTLKPGEWHLPYLTANRNIHTGELMYGDEVFNQHDNTPLFEYYKLEDAIKISCARCAAVSFRNEDYGLEKCLEVYERLVGDERKHASAFEHQATPIREHGYYNGVLGEYQSNNAFIPFTWEEGISHVDRKGQLWSGNLRGWIQYRKTIPGECYAED